MIVLASCGQSRSVPADEMSAEQLANAIEQVAVAKPKKPPPPAPPPGMSPLLSGDADDAFRREAVCSFGGASGILVLASPQRAVARIGGQRILLSSASPVPPDGAYLTSGDTRISIGLASGTEDLSLIARGKAEARLLRRGLPDQSVPGSWTCRMGRL